MEIDLEWCLICSQRVRDGSPYCSQQCRDQEESSNSPRIPGLYSSLVIAPLASCDSSESVSRNNDGFFSLSSTSDDIACASSTDAPTTPLEAPSPSSPTYPTLSFARRAYDQNPTAPLPPLPPSVYSKRLSYEFWAQNEYKTSIHSAPAPSEKKVT